MLTLPRTRPAIFYLLFSLWIGQAYALDITGSGGWSFSVGASDLVTGAGSNLSSSYTSATNTIILSTSNTSGASWAININRTDTTWSADLTLAVQRTSDGTGGSISGGTSYTTIGTTDTQFFTGSGDVSGINLQLRLTGVSVTLPPNTYSTTITFTII